MHAVVAILLVVLVAYPLLGFPTLNLASDERASGQPFEPVANVDMATTNPGSAEPLIVNVMPNPSFEDWAGNKPNGYDAASSTGYASFDYAYSGPGVTGNYAGLVESQGSQHRSGDGHAYQMLPSTALIKPGISLSLSWNALANPDMASGGYVYVHVSTQDGVGNYLNLYYVVSHGVWSYGNGSNDVYFLLNGSLNQWNSFDRNITEDFLDAYGSDSLSDTQYIQYLWLRTYSPPNAMSVIQCVFDNVDLTNGTYSDWILNGDFETGTGIHWFHQNYSLGYVGQSTDSTDGTFSLNLSVPTDQGGYGNAYVSKYFDFPGGYFGSAQGQTIFEFDWKYNDALGVGMYQYSNIRLTMRNSSGSYWLYLYFGAANNMTYDTNTTSSYSFEIPGFGVRGTWQHTSIDLYQYITSAGFLNVSLYQITVFTIANAPGSSVSLLLDNFRMITHPLGDPGFEVDWYSSSLSPFAGWHQWLGDASLIQRSSDSYLGKYACNLTVSDSGSAGVYRSTYIPLNPSDLTNFTWRLDDMGAVTSNARIEFHLTGGYNVYYLLGSGSNYGLTNSSGSVFITPPSYNSTGEWHHLVANLTYVADQAFGLGVGDVIERVVIAVFAPEGQRVSALFDEMHFVDGAPPVIDAVDLDPLEPMYYDEVNVTIHAYDTRTGIQQVSVRYSNGSGWYEEPAEDMGGYYLVTIPAHDYGTVVAFEVIATDNGNLDAVDNNGGSYYSYVVGDDIDPTVTIDSPADMAEVEGITFIQVTAYDLGSGVERVEFYLGEVSFATDYEAPYSSPLNLNLLSLGMHTINVVAYDAAGNSASDSINIIVVDNTAPSIDSPADIEFEEGETGYLISWNPSDARPNSFEVLVNGTILFSGSWNSSSELINVSLDGVAAGIYNYTCVVYDDGGNWSSDTVLVAVNEVTTTTTTTTSTTTTTTSTSPPPGGVDPLLALAIVGVVAAVGVLLVVFVVIPRMKGK